MARRPEAHRVVPKSFAIVDSHTGSAGNLRHCSQGKIPPSVSALTHMLTPPANKFYCTWRVTLVESLRLPEVPVTVSVYVPAGVELLVEDGDGELPPPQATENATSRASMANGASRLNRKPFWLYLAITINPNKLKRASHAVSGSGPEGGVNVPGSSGPTIAFPVVLTVSLADASLVPSRVTEAGCTEQVEWAGAPEQDKLTA